MRYELSDYLMGKVENIIKLRKSMGLEAGNDVEVILALALEDYERKYEKYYELKQKIKAHADSGGENE